MQLPPESCYRGPVESDGPDRLVSLESDDFATRSSMERERRKPTRTNTGKFKRGYGCEFENEVLARLRQLDSDLRSCHEVLYKKLEHVCSKASWPDNESNGCGVESESRSRSPRPASEITAHALSAHFAISDNEKAIVAPDGSDCGSHISGEHPRPARQASGSLRQFVSLSLSDTNGVCVAEANDGSRNPSRAPSERGPPSRRPSIGSDALSQSVISKSGISVNAVFQMGRSLSEPACQAGQKARKPSICGSGAGSPRNIVSLAAPSALQKSTSAPPPAFAVLPSLGAYRDRHSASGMPGEARLVTRSSSGAEATGASRELAVSLFARRAARSEYANIAWNFLDNPESGLAARAYATFEPYFLVCTMMFALMQTLEESPMSAANTRAVDFAIDLFFFVEIFVRFIVSPSHGTVFFAVPWNIIDILSVLPMFPRIVFILCDVQEVDFLYCAVAIIRLLKLMRRFQKIHLLVGAFQLTVEALPVLMFTLATITLFFSCAIYLVEPRDNFDCLPRAIWFTIVTMTTVGYGDVVPVSITGILLSSVLTITSVLYMAVPLGIVGHAFTQVWEDRDRILLVKKTQAALLQWGYTANDIPLVFSIFDSAGEGELNLHDFRKMINQMCIGLSDKRICELFCSFDQDGDGFVDDREFVRRVFPTAYHEVYSDAASNSMERQESNQRRIMETACFDKQESATRCACGNSLVPSATFCGMCGRKISLKEAGRHDFTESSEIPGVPDSVSLGTNEEASMGSGVSAASPKESRLADS